VGILALGTNVLPAELPSVQHKLSVLPSSHVKLLMLRCVGGSVNFYIELK